MRRRSTGEARPDSEDLGLERQEIDGPGGTGAQTPHVPGHDRGAEIQEDLPSPSAAPVLPANAGGSDRLPTGDQDEKIDDESMYERRPERGIANPPSDRVAAEDDKNSREDNP